MAAAAAPVLNPNPTVTSWNPWPAGIVGFLVFFFGATLGLVGVAVRQPADLVGRDYYEQEIRYQSQIDRVSRARALPGVLSASYDPAAGALRVALPGIPAGERASGEIRLYRPSDPALDRRMPLAVGAEGVQWVSAPRLTPGLWRAQVTWTTSRGAYSDACALNVPGFR